MTRHPIPEHNAVAAMFDRIARRYDFLNRLLSFGTDIRWRRRLVSLLPDKASRVLDVATGTADVLLAALKQNRTTQGFGADVSVGMMQVGLRKIAAQGFADRTFLFHADARALPFVANAFSAVTVAFGVRNFADLEGGLQEIYRVLAPGGTFAFTTPSEHFGEFLFGNALMRRTLGSFAAYIWSTYATCYPRSARGSAVTLWRTAT